MARISSVLEKIALWYDYIIVCKDIKSKIIHSEKLDDGFDGEVCEWGLELTNPVEYTKEELLKKYDGKQRVYRWAHTYTEDGQPAMAIVLEEE
jgi:hypothetical protein